MRFFQLSFDFLDAFFKLYAKVALVANSVAYNVKFGLKVQLVSLPYCFCYLFSQAPMGVQYDCWNVFLWNALGKHIAATTQHSDWYSFSQFYCYCWSLSIKTRTYTLFLQDDHDLTHIPFSFPSNCEYSCSQTFKKAERMYFHKHFPSRETQDDKDDVAESCLFLFNFPVCLMPLLM